MERPEARAKARTVAMPAAKEKPAKARAKPRPGAEAKPRPATKAKAEAVTKVARKAPAERKAFGPTVGISRRNMRTMSLDWTPSKHN